MTDYYYDQVEEWRAVLSVMMERDTQPYRHKKLGEIRDALLGLRSPPTDGARYIVVTEGDEVLSNLLPHDEAATEIDRLTHGALPFPYDRSQLRIERVGDAPGSRRTGRSSVRSEYPLWERGVEGSNPSVQIVSPEDEWPGGLSDGVTLACSRCGVVPPFDYRVDSDFWCRVIPKSERRGVVCLPCLDAAADLVGENAIAHLEELQFCGNGKTAVFAPVGLFQFKHKARIPRAWRFLMRRGLFVRGMVYGFMIPGYVVVGAWRGYWRGVQDWRRDRDALEDGARRRVR